MTAHSTTAARPAADAPAPNWRTQAACRGTDPEWFYWMPDSRPKDEPKPWEWRVLEVCWSCPVVAECLAEALKVPADHQWGVRGGMTAAQRKTALSWRSRRGETTTRPALTELPDMPEDVDAHTVRALLDGFRVPGAATPEKRWAAVGLHRRGWPLPHVGAFLGHTERVVTRWIAQAEATKGTAA